MEIYSENDWAELNDWIQLLIAARSQGLSRNEIRSFLGLLPSTIQANDRKNSFDESTSPYSTKLTKVRSVI